MLKRWAQIWTERPPLSREVGKGSLVEVVGTEFRTRPHKRERILRFQIDTGKMVITVRISGAPRLLLSALNLRKQTITYKSP